MHIEIREEGPGALAEYASVPIAFRVVETLDVDAVPTPGRVFPLRTRPITKPTLKDNDLQPGNSPMDWPARFDVSGWGVLGAHADGQRIGGAIVSAEPSIELPACPTGLPCSRSSGTFGSRQRFDGVVWVESSLPPPKRGRAALPTTLVLDVVEHGAVHFCHATPRSVEEIFTLRSPENRAVPMLSGVAERTIVCGHTHMQFDRRIDPWRRSRGC